MAFRKHRLLRDIVSCAVFLFIFVANSSEASVAAPEPAVSTKASEYEYAHLLQAISKEFDSQNFAVLTTPEERVESENIKALYSKLGGTLPVEKVSLLSIFNLLGQKGWELVYSPGFHRTEKKTRTNSYLFRRLVISDEESQTKFECSQLFIWDFFNFFHSTDGKVEAKDLKELFRKLNADPGAKISLDALVETIKERGWKVAVTEDDRDRKPVAGGIYYFFVRPIESD